MSFTFIPNNAIFIKPCITNFKEIIDNWNYYETEKNLDMINYIWNFILPHIPKICNNERIVGYDLDKTTLIKTYCKSSPISKKIYEKEKVDKNGNVSLVTVLIFCNHVDGKIRFYDDKKNGISFKDPNHNFYESNIETGNTFIFTNKVIYEESLCSENKYVLKIPIFYTSRKKFNKKNNIKYKKTYEIPTPNGEKFKKVECLINSNVVTLTPDLNNKINIKRWKDVESKNKMLNIPKYKLPDYIDVKKRRPPTDKEDYCPNCFEILSINPINYTNCSGCLTPIKGINM